MILMTKTVIGIYSSCLRCYKLGAWKYEIYFDIVNYRTHRHYRTFRDIGVSNSQTSALSLHFSVAGYRSSKCDAVHCVKPSFHKVVGCRSLFLRERLATINDQK